MRALPVTVILLLILASAPLPVSGQETAVQAGPSSFSITKTSYAYVSEDPGPEVVYDGQHKMGGDALIMRSSTCPADDDNTDPTPGAEIDIEFSLVTDAGASVGFRIVYEIQFVIMDDENTTGAYVRVYVWDYGQEAWEQLDEETDTKGWVTNRSFSSDYMSGSGTVKVRLHTGHDAQNCDAYAEIRAYEFAIQLDDDSQSNGTTGPDDEESTVDPSPEDGGGESVSGGWTADDVCGTIFFLLLILAAIQAIRRWLITRYKKGKIDRFPPKEILDSRTKEMLGFTPSQPEWRRMEISEPILLTARPDATLATILFLVDLKQESKYRVVVYKGGDLSKDKESQKLLDHIEHSLHHQHGADYSIDGSNLSRFQTDRSSVLGYADPTIYRTHPEPHSGYGNRFMPTSAGKRPFIFGSLDGLLVWTSLSGERDELIEICGNVVDNHLDWSRAMEGQETGPQSHDDRIKPNKLSWLLMDSTTRHGAFLNSKYDHRKKRGHVPAVGQKRLVEAPEFLALKNRFGKFLAKKEQIVHRIKAKNMHGDCRAANWIWHYGARRPTGTTPDRKYRVIDYANYMTSSFKLGRRKESRPLNRENTLQIKGEEGPEEITWVRPFILGRGETRPHTDDTLPDPLFDLAELIASLLLDLWVDPEEEIEDEMSHDYGGQTRRELIHEVFFEEGEKSRVALKFQFAYESIIAATIPRVEKWIDSIDDSRRSRNRSGVRAKEATKEWFRWAIADRLMYRACVISTNSGYDLLIAEDDENGTPEIALKIALKVLDFDEEQHKKSPEVGYDLEKYIQYFGNVINIDASDNKGTQKFNIEQKSDIVVEDRQGSKYGIDSKMKAIPRFKNLYRGNNPLSYTLHDVETGEILERRPRSSPSFLQNRTADWKPDTKVWAELDDGQFKFALINQVRESSEGELEMDITTHVTGSEDTEEDRMTLPMAKVSRRIAVLKSKGVPTDILYKYHLVGAPRFEVGQTVYIEDLDRASEFDLPPIEERNPLSFGQITHFYLCPHRNPKERRIIVEVQMDHTDELHLYPYERLHLPDI